MVALRAAGLGNGREVVRYVVVPLLLLDLLVLAALLLFGA